MKPWKLAASRPPRTPVSGVDLTDCPSVPYLIEESENCAAWVADMDTFQHRQDIQILRQSAWAAEADGRRQLTYRDWRTSEKTEGGFPAHATAETMRRRHGSWNGAKRLAGVALSKSGPERVWTRRAVVLALIAYRVEWGWFPTKRDLEYSGPSGIAGIRRFPDPKTVRLRLGSLSRARRIAEWLYDRDPSRWQTVPLER